MKPLVAHCRMILLPEDYNDRRKKVRPVASDTRGRGTRGRGARGQGTRGRGTRGRGRGTRGRGGTKKAQELPLEEDSVDVQLAKKIAEHILLKLGLTLESLEDVLYGSGGHNEPGDRVDMTDWWKNKYFLIRNGDDSEEDEEEDDHRN